jgi:breast cancer 2 susceptibility protein
MKNFDFRRNQVAEAAFMRMEREDAPIFAGDNMGEGAKLFHSLETAAEPELLMADMTAAQLAAFAAYQTKREVIIC